MALAWIEENPAHWDADKERVIIDRERIFPGLSQMKAGDLAPGTWWRVEDDGEVVGYGWMDTTWGDAEVLLAVSPSRRGQGVGTFVMDHLESEARARGLNHLYNAIPPRHPEAAQLAAWLEKRHFRASEDKQELRRAVRR